MMKLFTETQPMSNVAEQTELQVLDEAMWDEVSGGDPMPQIDNEPH